MLKKFLKLFLISSTLFVLIPINITAKEKTTRAYTNSYDSSSSEAENIIDAKIEKGDLYIYVLEKNTKNSFRAIGPCPSKTKEVTKQISRKDLIKMREELKTQNNISASLIGFLVGFVNPALGAITGFLSGQTKDSILKNVENALDNSKKDNFTITSSYKCKETNFGVRGKVHVYKLTYVSIL